MEDQREDSLKPMNRAKSVLLLQTDLRDKVSLTDLRSKKRSNKIEQECIFKEVEHKVMNLIKNELKRQKELLSSDYPECTEKRLEDDSIIREASLKIIIHVLKNMNQTDLVNILQKVTLNYPLLSIKSVESVHHPETDMSNKDNSTHLRSEKRSNKNKIESLFKEVEHKVMTLIKNELKRQKEPNSYYPACTERGEDEEDVIVRGASLKIIIHVLKNMNHTDIVNILQKELVSVYQQYYTSKMRHKYKRICETSQLGIPTLLNEIYTELHITEGSKGDIKNEQEVRQIEMPSKRPTSMDKPIKCNDLFKEASIRNVLTTGIAGIGKTVSVQKFIVDWAEGKANQDVTFVFPLPFRELNLMKLQRLSLMDLLHHFFPEIKEIQSATCDTSKVLFIFDGLDECRLPLNFQKNETLYDVTESASLDVLLMNLIKGNLLPSALLWITSRPAATSQIPSEFVHQLTEVRGFNNSQKEEYFRKRISDQRLANKIISHMKSSRSLYIMCHIPVFCWISATVLERMLGEAGSGEIPKTLTQMFTHFLILQIKHKDRKYHQKLDHDLQKTREIILALGKLAFQQLEKGNLIFYEDDLRECGIDVKQTVCCGICTQIFRQELALQLRKVFSFVHLSVQEFLAALYAFLHFINKTPTEQPTSDLFDVFHNSSMSDFLKNAVNKALQSENGHLDLFLRFLLGLSLNTNQTLLRSLLPETGRSSCNKEETVEHIKQKIRENPSTEKSINLFHCLNELNDRSLEQEVQTYLKPGGYHCLNGIKFSDIQWSALVFVLLMSTQEFEEFDLRMYDPSERCFLRLLPVVKESRRAVLCGCHLSSDNCRVLSSVLISSSLRELNLSDNTLDDAGVQLLSEGLRRPECKLEKLWLVNCGITDNGFVALASALKSNPMSHLKELNLNRNKPGEMGVRMLSDLQKDENCKLETLGIDPDPYELDKRFHSHPINNTTSSTDKDLVEFVITQKRRENFQC